MKKFKSNWTFFIHNYRLTYILVGIVILLGLISIVQMPKESSPEIDLPIIVVSTALPGANAVDVEELVTNEIESRVQNLPDVDTVTSTSRPGFSTVVVNFDINAVGAEKLSTVRDRIAQVSNDLPSDATDPTATQVSFSDVPIFTFSLGGPFPAAQLNQYAEDLKADLERIPNVSKVNIVGALDREIQVVVEQGKLDQYGLSISQVTGALSAANTDIPIGAIETAGEVFTVRFGGRLTTIDEVGQVAVASKGGTSILVRDIGQVVDTFSQSNTITRLSTNGDTAEPALSVQVYKTSGKGDILTIADSTEEIIAAAQHSYLPDETIVSVVQNDAKQIRGDLNNLLTSGLFTMIIIAVTLTLFLGWKEALLASLAVPLTFLGTFIFLESAGYTINFLTLFSLILALGILVDGSIVMTEGIFGNMQKGMSPRHAAIEAIHEFEMPLISGVFTTIFVFLPMLMMSGIMGKFIESIPVTISAVLLISLAIALGVITTAAARFFKPVDAIEKKTHIADKAIAWVYTKYGGLFKVFTRSRVYSKRLIYTMVILFILSLSLPFVGVLKINMFPADDFDSVYIDIENPIGTPLSVTNLMMAVVENELYDDPYVDSFETTIGSSSNATGNSLSGSERGSIVVNLVEKRDISSTEAVHYFEKKLDGIISAPITVSQLSGGPEQGSPVQINIKGDVFDDSEAVARQVAALLKDIPGTKNVKDGIIESNGEFVIEVDRQKAQLYGITAAGIAGVLRNSVSGLDATVIKNNGEDIDVVVKSYFPHGASGSSAHYGADKIDIASISAITISTPRGNIPLTSFATIRYGNSRASISHKDSERILIATSDVLDGYNAGVIVSEIQKQLENVVIPTSVSVSYGGETEDINQSFADLGKAMVLGILSIFALLVWQFKSWRQPLFILATIPLAMIGVLPGLAITGQPFSFPGFIGVVALAGIVVNNAIILIDSINNNRRRGMSKIDAVEESTQSRLQPILLTTITTVAGMVPLAISSPTWAPIAYSIIFGLTFSTILTLFVVPVLYVLFGETELDEIVE